MIEHINHNETGNRGGFITDSSVQFNPAIKPPTGGVFLGPPTKPPRPHIPTAQIVPCTLSQNVQNIVQNAMVPENDDGIGETRRVEEIRFPPKEYEEKRTKSSKTPYIKDLEDLSLTIPFLRSFIRPNQVPVRGISTGLGIICLMLCVYNIVLFTSQIKHERQAGESVLRVEQNKSLALPLVTICTNSRINATKARNIGINPQLLAYLLSSYKGFYLFYNERNGKLINETEPLQLQYKELVRKLRLQKDEAIRPDGSMDLSRFFLRHGFQCHELIKACMVQGTVFDCCRHSHSFLSEKGKCFNLRSPLFTHQSIPGPSGGLNIYMRNHEEEYPEAFINDYPDSGVQVHLNWHENGHHVTSNPINASPGTHVSVKMDLHKRHLDEASSKCLPASINPLQYSAPYTRDRCYAECLLGLMFKTCTCFQLGLVPEAEKVDPHFICDPLRATTCVQPLMQGTNMGFLWDMYDTTKHCDCPAPCKEWRYDTSVSYSTLPNAGYILEWMRAVDKALDRRSGSPHSGSTPLTDDIVLDVYYSTFDYSTLTPVQPTPRLIGVSSCLLQMGVICMVCIGLDLISIMQLIFLSALAVWSTIRWKNIIKYFGQK